MYKLLIVDDEPLILAGFDALLPWEEYGVELMYKASSGQEALEIIQRSPVDILITDIKMPGMDGLELIERVRDMGLALSIIILSGYDDFHLIKRALGFGIENYLLKPIEEEELGGTLLVITDKLERKRRTEDHVREGHQLLRENILIRLMNDAISDNELTERAQLLGLYLEGDFVLACRAAIDGGRAELAELSRVADVLSQAPHLLAAPGLDGDLTLLFCWDGDELSLERCAWILDERAQAAGVRVHARWGSVQRGRERASQSYRDTGSPILTEPVIPLVESVIGYIGEHLADELSLKTLAQRYRMNPAYLGQLFKRATGELFSAYLARERIERAKALLAGTEYRTSEVALMVGYPNTNYFSNQFKRLTGLYPTEYRRTGEACE